MLKQRNILPKKLKASALLSSILVLATCLLFFKLYQDILHRNIQNNQMIVEYLDNN